MYVKVNDVIEQVLLYGKGSLMVKMDIELVIPADPDDRPLLCMRLEDQLHVYVDLALLFGLRSSPKIFNSIADAQEWVVKDKGV